MAGTTLSELTDGVVDADDPPTGPDVPAYTLEMALSGLFVEPEQLTEMLSLLRRRRNLVLQGPPGTGKTYVASRLARVLIGANIPDQIERTSSKAFARRMQAASPARMAPSCGSVTPPARTLARPMCCSSTRSTGGT